MSVEASSNFSAAVPSNSLGPLRQIDAGLLNVGYVDIGSAQDPVVVLLYGWPYDIHSYVDVCPGLTEAGYRVVVPYLRGFGTTRFLSDETFRNGEQAVLAVDVIALMDALEIERAIVAGFDWGARTADIVAALWPERCAGLVSVSGYLIVNLEANQRPLPPKAELGWWYQYYFATERGRLGYSENRREFNKLIWQIASPKWDFDDETFDRTAASFDNPDHVDIVIHNYRWRLSLAKGEPQHGNLENPAVRTSDDHRADGHHRQRLRRSRRRRTCLCRQILGPVLASNPQRHRTQRAPRSPRCLHRRHPRRRRWTAVSFFSRLRTAGSLPVEGRLPGFDGATGWLNSPPLGAADLDGKVVLVDFWTYTCINWLRTLAYVRAWSERYAYLGLVVVGVHTPEFPFERDVANVRQAVKDMAVDYPVALDSDYAIWQAFANRFWPAIYIADAEGRIRHHQFGEGGYAECEMVIQRLLGESGRGNMPRDLVQVAPTGLEVQADWASLKSPESYLGYEQARGFASLGDAVLDQTHSYVAPNRLNLNNWALAGDWTIERRASVLDRAGGRLVVRFHARDVHLVMGPQPQGASVPFRILVDGEPPGEAHGLDVDDQGSGTVSEQRLYQLIRQPGSITDRTFEITFLAPGAEAYVFTFG